MPGVSMEKICKKQLIFLEFIMKFRRGVATTPVREARDNLKV